MTKNARLKRIAGVATLATACLLILGGCSNSADQQRIAELEQQVETLQQEVDNKDDGSGDTGPSTTTTGDSGSDVSYTPPAPDTSVTANYPELADFETWVAALEESCAAVASSGDTQANYQTYMGKKQELDALDDEMDRYDDQQELAARSGSITYADYTQIETAIDLLSDRLEYAEDSMMYKLGIYDD